MNILFYGNRKGTLVDKLIRWWTSDTFADKFNGNWRDGFSHVELEFRNNVMFSSSGRDGICRFKFKNPASEAWVSINVPTTADEETKLRNYCYSMEGTPYDYAGILGFVIGTPDARNKVFCAEVCMDALMSIGLFDKRLVDTGKLSPNEMYKLALHFFPASDKIK